jgi:hypothetical protein
MDTCKPDQLPRTEIPMNTNTSPINSTPATAWTAWRQLSDDLVVRLAIDAASRRIASQYAR